ncbi:MAG TPA: LuxR C-terminal-related transcriptional regulator, partial [Mycobacterium sp.]|nr:LuxR C-terminal-related transcriptional regulator [Mycobacterium sp.]
TEPERVLFRRLAVFAGGFDLEAAQAVGASSEVEGYQLIDQLSLLVDKSLVVADDTGAGMRYRLLETVRQYAQEKLGESGEADEVRTRHRDYYTRTAAELESRGHARDDELLEWAQTESDNLRAAFAWSRENSDPATALRLIESLRPLWLRGGRVKEALVGLDAILADDSHSQMPPAVWVGAVTLRAMLGAWVGVSLDLDGTRQALAIARQLDDPQLITRALTACGRLANYSAEDPGSYFAEATELARAAGDRWNLCQIFGYQAGAAFGAGEPVAACAAAEEGRDLADALGDRFLSRMCRAWLSLALMMRGDGAHASQVSSALIDEAEAAGDLTMKVYGHVCRASVLAFHGDAAAAYEAAQSALSAAEAIGGFLEDSVYASFANAALAAGDAAAAMRAAQNAWRHTNPQRELFTRQTTPMAEAALACGDLAVARRWADDTAATVSGWYRVRALTVRAFIAVSQGDTEQAERDVHDALTLAVRTRGYLRVADTLECLARLAADDCNHPYAARLLGAAAGIRQRMGIARMPMYQADYDSVVNAVREALGQDDFDAAWAEGAALSTEEAVAYAQRGRGERKRPTSGWGSLTPMENDVVTLVREGLGNKEIGARLFISPRTVQTHLTHVYAKLGLTSRVQLVQLSLEGGQKT